MIRSRSNAVISIRLLIRRPSELEFAASTRKLVRLAKDLLPDRQISLKKR